MRKALIERDRNLGGQQRLYRFANGYGASVVQGPHTYGGPVGLWEVAVLSWPEARGGGHFDLVYDTPVTDDVLGWLTDEQVDATLDQIEALPPHPSLVVD